VKQSIGLPVIKSCTMTISTLWCIVQLDCYLYLYLHYVVLSS